MKIIDCKELMEQWDFDKNIELDPNLLSIGSAKKAWWICDKKHSWQDEIRGRAVKGNGCPYCSGHRVLAGFNDLKTTHPNLVLEWDYEKNGDKKPENYSQGSGIKIWWKCEYGHSWKAAIYHRTGDRGCPVCNSTRQTSFAEQSIYYYLKKIYPDTISRYIEIFSNGMEIDIYIPSIKIGIEYDGMYYHKGNKSYLREKEKYNICKSKGIKLIRIKEKIENEKNNTADYIIKCGWSSGNYEDLDKTLNKLFDYLNLKISSDTKKDRNEIFKLYKANLKNNSLAALNPTLAKEWNYEKNEGLTPDMFVSNSGISVWWKCDNGHEWKASINKRNSNQNCPYCSNHRVITGYNDFASNNPYLMKEWDYEKNKSIDPYKVSSGSPKKVWWKCDNGHEWKTSIQKRNDGSNCPYCQNKLVKKGYNDIFTLFPNLEFEWDYEKNKSIDPYKVSSGSPKKVWWKCNNGHIYNLEIFRKCKGVLCPYCTNKRILSGYNDLKTLFPEIAKEWNYEKNKPVLPENISSNSNRKFWWKCDKGHEWLASPINRKKHNCPYCCNQKIMFGFNDLFSLRPDIIEEWDYESNKHLDPKNIGIGSSKKANWICKKCGFKWQSEIRNKVKGIRCPSCHYNKNSR